MKRSIALGFVIYNPEISFASRVQMAVESGFDVYIFDNTPEKPSLGALVDWPSNIKYVTCGKNHGLGLGIQSVCARAYYDHHDALVFFDQDSVFDESTLLFIEKFYVEHPEFRRYSMQTRGVKSKNVASEMSHLRSIVAACFS
jgi:rhamnosyltransferase